MYTDKNLFKALFMVQLFAAFLVTMGHYTADIGSFTSVKPWDTALNHISRFGTVILAMITGFFTAHSFGSKRTTVIPFFRGKLIYIVIPFLIAGVLYHEILNGSWPNTIQDFMNILIGKSAGHLYFIFMLIQYYVFAFTFRKFITRKTILVVIALFFAIQYAFIETNFNWRGLGIRSFFPTWIFTIYMGHLMYEYRKELFEFLQKYYFLFFFMFIISISSTFYFAVSVKLYTANHLPFVIATVVIIVTLLQLFMYLMRKITIPFQKGLSFFIYLSHSYILIHVNRYFYRNYDLASIMNNKWTSLAYLGLIFTLSLLFSLIVAILFNALFRMLSRKKKGQ